MERFLAHRLGKMSRRSFLKACTIATAAMGLPAEMVGKVAEAAASPQRPPVIWLHFMECTGCTESLLRSSHPDVARLILDLISLDYHETLMAAAGHQAETVLEEQLKKNEGRFICVVEGAISKKDGGIYCKIGGRTALEILNHVAPKAQMVIAIGACASFGGIQAAHPNPTGAVGVRDIIKVKPVINIPGCPPNPYNILGTILHTLTFGRPPETDELGRPKFAYGRKIHDHCPRRPHFDEGRFVEAFGDPGHQKGYCLYKVGCKGPVTYSNCPVIRFCDVGAWPVGSGHGCIGCTEPGFWDTMTPFYEHLPEVYIPAGGGIRKEAEKIGKVAVGGALAVVATHAAVGVIKKMVKSGQEKEEE
ncbi:hydrogenase small subunit [Thermosulfuriphilus ammonigenes]|uniref:Hydrogenase small subunit n=1 Tax=Thermosulfuriphilus ammonigenes TaxID=1936021 RepID=A0A6G7PVS9_9BACT|nr:hydrogenase small subunit [Thermosulfuriphilus ammonigenes]MBA2848127.1 hydrogenase small subunit/[NiFe] hydrogenase small subunit [Thermosulfuriphilus ammonigenes]QIJ71697.1 hydrogenase small subunit [Thermosulfuriphilus ammonigenes]